MRARLVPTPCSPAGRRQAFRAAPCRQHRPSFPNWRFAQLPCGRIGEFLQCSRRSNRKRAAPGAAPSSIRRRCSLRQQPRLIDEPIARARAHYPACGEGSPNGLWNAQLRRAIPRAAARAFPMSARRSGSWPGWWPTPSPGREPPLAPSGRRADDGAGELAQIDVRDGHDCLAAGATRATNTAVAVEQAIGCRGAERARSR